MTGTRLKPWAWVCLPVVLSLFLYRRSFRIWFLADDFAWLGLRLSVSSWQDFLAALFTPMAQGTIRTLSERLFFLAFESGFGMESLPMRIWMFATLAAAEVFLVLIVQRLTQSWPIASLAAILWALNFGVTAAMSWLSSYNQILLSALVLASLYCFIRYGEDGGRRWLAASWIAFLLGFGALESIIMLPGLLLFWALLFRRSAIRPALPFFAPAIAFALAHLFVIPKDTSHPAYRMHFDRSILDSVAIYWGWLLGAVKLRSFDPTAYEWLVSPAQWLLTAAIVGFLTWRTFRRDYVPVFGAAMSIALLLPMLPLSDHRTDYYLASASIGFSILLATIPLRTRWAGLALLCLYIYPCFIVQGATFEWYLERSGPVRVLLRGLKYVAAAHPAKLILVEGVDTDLYWSAMADDALRLVNAQRVRLAPGEGPEGNPLRISPAAVRTAFEHEAVLVYRLHGDKLRDVTHTWESSKALTLTTGLAPIVDAGQSFYSQQFGEGWYEISGGNRWLSAAGSLRLGGPFPANALVFLKAYCPKSLPAARISLEINGEPQPEREVQPGDVALSWPLPAKFLSARDLQLRIRSSSTIPEPESSRQLSLVFGQIGVR